MAITVVQNRSVAGSTFTFASTPTNGNVVILAGGTNAASASPVAPAGQGFSGSAVGPNTTVGGLNDYAFCFWKRWTTGGGNSFPVTNLGGIAGIYGWEVSGLSTTSIAMTLTTNGGQPAGTSINVQSVGTTPTEDVFAVSCVAGNTSFTSPAVSGWGDVVKVVNPVAVAWETFATQQTNIAADWSWAGTITPVGIIVIFNGTDTGVTPGPTSSLPVYLNTATGWVEGVEMFNDGSGWV